MREKEIRAVYDEKTIRVYQAYSDMIADEAIWLGTFGKHFSLNRMTWIKPSFLWMMYRCGWAEKENQERVLAIDIKREAFDKAVQDAVVSTYNEELNISKEEWQKRVKESDIRIQWDPEKDTEGNNLPYRSIQLGIRGAAIKEYVSDWIVRIEDITQYVKRLNQSRKNGADIAPLLPKEQIYPL